MYVPSPWQIETLRRLQPGRRFHAKSGWGRVVERRTGDLVRFRTVSKYGNSVSVCVCTVADWEQWERKTNASPLDA